MFAGVTSSPFSPEAFPKPCSRHHRSPRTQVLKPYLQTPSVYRIAVRIAAGERGFPLSAHT
jgi:hypothetical protein